MSKIRVRRISFGGALSRLVLAAFTKAAQEMKQDGRFTFVRDMFQDQS